MIGLALGVALSFAATRVLASMLFEVDARDPITFGTAALVLTSAALLAVLIPARRATRVEPLRSITGS